MSKGRAVAKIFLNGVLIGTLDASQMHGLTKQLVEESYFESMKDNLINIARSRRDEMISSIAVKARFDNEPILVQAFKEASKKSVFGRNEMRFIDLAILDSMLPRRKRGDIVPGRGWWAVLEGKKDIVETTGYTFIPFSEEKKKTLSSRGKHGEGILLEIARNPSLAEMPVHSYSIKDKRYLTKFKTRLVDDMVKNKAFMDKVIRQMCDIIFIKLSSMKFNVENPQEEEEDDHFGLPF